MILSHQVFLLLLIIITSLVVLFLGAITDGSGGRGGDSDYKHNIDRDGEMTQISIQGNDIHNDDNDNSHIAYAHFFGASKYVDNYQIVFQSFPFVPFVHDNSTTLNFSILDNNNSNVNNVYAALVVKEKNTDRIVGQIPYKFYEFSDITFRYPFQNVGDYVVTFEAKINGDPKYQDNPLISSFDISVSNLNKILPFAQLMLYYVIPATVAIAGVAIYALSKSNKEKYIL